MLLYSSLAFVPFVIRSLILVEDSGAAEAWFLLELVLRVASEGRKLFYGEDRPQDQLFRVSLEDWMWAWLDVLVVVTSVWEAF